MIIFKDKLNKFTNFTFNAMFDTSISSINWDKTRGVFICLPANRTSFIGCVPFIIRYLNAPIYFINCTTDMYSRSREHYL